MHQTPVGCLAYETVKELSTNFLRITISKCENVHFIKNEVFHCGFVQ